MSSRLRNFAFALFPILVSLGITVLLILAVDASPVEVFETVWQGAFRTSNAFAGVVNFWIPLTLCAMGLVITFTAGLWNIGVEGQMGMGAVFASYGALFITLPQPAQIAVEIGLAMLGGALWAAVVGILKTKLGVHEIFGGVALNALTSLITVYLVTNLWATSTGSSRQSTDTFGAHAVLPPLSNEFPVSLLMLLLVLAVLAVVTLLLRGTRWGLQLKATGKNNRSALLLGVPTTRSAISALMVCGALAGIAGAYRVLFTYNSLRTSVTGGIGFLALLVVLLVGARILWVPLITFASAVILGGSTRLKIALQLDQSLAGVMQGLIVLSVLLGSGVRQRWQERSQRSAQETAAAVASPPATVQETTSHE